MGGGGLYRRQYDITVTMQPPPLIAKAFGVNWQKIVEVANSAFIKKLVKMVNDELKKQGRIT